MIVQTLSENRNDATITIAHSFIILAKVTLIPPLKFFKSITYQKYSIRIQSIYHKILPTKFSIWYRVIACKVFWQISTGNIRQRLCNCCPVNA